MDLFRSAAAVSLVALLGPAAAANVSFAPTEPGSIYLDGQRVVFTAKGANVAAHAQVRDYGGKVVREVAVSSDRVDLGALPCGYYEIACSEDGTRAEAAPFVVVPRSRPHSRTAVDAAFSWSVPPDQFDVRADMLARAGCRWIRDRIWWGEVEPERGRFDWGKYDRSADALSRRGLSILQVFHATPGWARSDHAWDRMADDLRDVYHFAAAAACHFRGRVGAWEVWNEADIPMFFADPPSEYAAFLKAAYLGYKSGDPKVLVSQASFALSAERFGEGLRENGSPAYYDIFNYHDYDRPADFPKRAAVHFDLLRRSGMLGRPVWLTECGIGLQAPSGALTRDQLWRQAAFIAKSYATSFSLGTTEHFFFLFFSYMENGVQFGLMDSDARPRPAYAALATVTQLLGDARFRGEVQGVPGGARVFALDGPAGETLVAWTDGPPATAALPLMGNGARAARVEVRDIVGSLEARRADRSGAIRLSLSDSPRYVTLPRGVSAAGIVRPPLPGTAATPTAVRPHYALREIVLRMRAPLARSDKKEEAFRLKSGEPAVLEAQIYNFGRRPFSGTASIELPGGWGPVVRIPVRSLAPMGLQTETIRFTPEAGGGRYKIRGEIIGSSGTKSSPAVLELLME